MTRGKRMSEQVNFGYLFSSALETSPEQTAVIDQTTHLTFRELNERANQVAWLLDSRGIHKGDRVAILATNDLRYVEIVYGIMRAGAVAVPINIKLNKESIQYILEDSGVSFIFSEECFRPLIEEVKVEVFDLDSHVNGKKKEDYPINTTEEDLCFLLYTSGSTGRPKGCMLTHGGQYWNAGALQSVRGLDETERLLIFAPLYHANALVNVQSTLLSGGSVVILPKVDEQLIFEAIDREKVTFMTAVPAIYKMLLQYYEAHPVADLSSLRFLLCGSSELPEETFQAMAETFGVPVIESYGLSEGGPVVLSGRRNGKHGLQKLPEAEVRIDRTEEIDSTSGIGELWVKSPGVAVGYWNLPAITKERFTEDGWLKTGDLARIFSDGTAEIAGRKDDMISVGGENTYPKEVENILLKNPAVRDVRVLARPHELKGEVPVAAVITQEKEEIAEKDLQNFFIQNGPIYAYPRHVVFLDKLPLSGTGKIDLPSLERIVDKKISQKSRRVKQMGEIAQEIQTTITCSPFNSFLNVEVLNVEEESLTLRLPYQEVFRAGSESRGWYIHGGVIASFIDLIGDYVFVPSVGRPLPTIDLSVDYLRPAAPEDLFAEATIIKKGRSLGWSDIIVKNKEDKVIAIGRGIYSTK